MTATAIHTLQSHLGDQVTVHGWVTHFRSSGKIHFLMVRDGTGVVQCIIRPGQAVLEGPWVTEWDQLGTEMAVSLDGTVHADPRAPGGVEISLTRLRVLSESPDYPIQPKEHGVDFLLDHRHLWIRSPRQAAILRIRSRIIHAIRNFLDDQGFVVTDPPIITPAAAEGTTTLFEIDYFGEPAYLSQSGQLYLEALAMALGRVYSFGPTFRAEKSKTRRHLMEFWMVEPEIAFCEFEENLEWQERLVSHVVQTVLRECQDELKTLNRDVSRLAAVIPPFPRITYDEAVERLNQAGYGIAWGEDLGAPHETALAEMFDRPVFLTHFPKAIKAFYMQPDPERPDRVLAADLLAPEGYGEIVGGSQRIHDLSVLEARMRETGLDPERYQWYLDLRRYGSVPHSGFGMGLERLVAWIAGLEHVRETIPFPRTLNRVWP
ncbi:asparaginyl-tRNA synthetase [Sulfobacillus acidophilus TPY]|uniref:Asparagine--tRNA ligase n=1 Tax=Sulfobacillus acidophilus (strain ATCC 700253 / DSM 10332 / NAL) TaxID=679936 RepID=G8U0Q6_SULAD|nr:asparaginyl-tRNA synthetase [Sulfobacillus acidophilus TPY]AEW05359.1 asparaginyl-tRNA synthetase [Sulfobacillus acidophilus DSM 10332]